MIRELFEDAKNKKAITAAFYLEYADVWKHYYANKGNKEIKAVDGKKKKLKSLYAEHIYKHNINSIYFKQIFILLYIGKQKRMTSVSEQDLIKLGEQYLLEAEIKRKRAYAFYQIVKDKLEYNEQARQTKNNIIYRIETD